VYAVAQIRAVLAWLYTSPVLVEKRNRTRGTVSIAGPTTMAKSECLNRKTNLPTAYKLPYKVRTACEFSERK